MKTFVPIARGAIRLALARSLVMDTNTVSCLCVQSGCACRGCRWAQAQPNLNPIPIRSILMYLPRKILSTRA
ncbi:hypothetical protein B0H14DRAFT_2694169, partial [Mycena olivaceomarginata]